MAKWVEFVEVSNPDRQTKRWEVRAKRGLEGSVWIGDVAWSTGWRRYVLLPGYPSQWEQDCLRDVAAFLEAQTRDHKAARSAVPLCRGHHDEVEVTPKSDYQLRHPDLNFTAAAHRIFTAYQEQAA